MRIRVLKYFHIDLAGNIAEMCGIDSVLPFQNERKSVMSNIKLAEKHTEFMIKKGAVAVQAFHWRGLNNDTPIEELIKKAYKDSEISGKNYERFVRFVEGLEKELENDLN